MRRDLGFPLARAPDGRGGNLLPGGLVRRRLVAVAALALLAGCMSGPPSDSEDLCKIFEERPRWHRAATAAEKRWRIPTPVMMAVVYKESSYVAKARPPRGRLLGVVPWKRASSAYGFAQATDEAWSDYLRETRNRSSDRDDFADAIDFVGWYLNRSHRHLGIAPADARNLYLTYYAGMGGYSRGTWRNNEWLKDAAARVATRASRYERQLGGCRALDRRRR
ncbi:MAG: transglycosylase SLT domain-containing protein [Gammaproteobacteria bacterium]|nr:transglycosylase SLT domain-containing protein [Gammaproteobacteria bacterium]